MNLSDMDPQMTEMLIQALMKGQGNGGMQQELAAYDQMGPEGFRAHSNLGTSAERGALAAQDSQAQQDMVMRQLAHAQQMSQPVGRDYGTVAGNIAGGLGDIARQVGGGIRSHQLQGQQADLAKAGMAAQSARLDQMDATRAQSGAAQMEAIRKLQEALVGRQQPRGAQMSDAGLLESLVPKFGG